MNPYNVPIAKRTRLQKQLLDQGFCRSAFKKINREAGFSKYGVDHGYHEVIDVDDDDIDGDGDGDVGGNRASEVDTQYESDDKIDCYGTSTPFNPVAKRTRFQRQLLDQLFNGSNSGLYGSASKNSRKRKRDSGITQFGVNQEDLVVIDVDDDEDDADGGDYRIKNGASKIDTQYGYGSANPFKTGKHEYYVYSDQDDTVVSLEEEEDADEALQTSWKLYLGSENNMQAGSFQSAEDEPFSSSESEEVDLNKILNPTAESSDNFVHEKTVDGPNVKESYMEDSVYSLDNSDSDDGSVARKDKNLSVHKTNMKKTDKKPLEESSETHVHEKTADGPNVKESYIEDSVYSLDYSDSDDEPVARKEKNLSVHKTNMKKTVKKPLEESSETHVHEKQNAKNKVKDGYIKVDKTNSVKYNKYKRQGGRRDYGGHIDDILNSIISNDDIYDKKHDNCLPLKFRFDDSEDGSNQKTDECNGEDLFQEMEFAFECDEIGSYKIPKVENIETGDYYDDIDLCENGVHGDIYLEEQTGLRCCLCGAVLLESRYVIQKLATYAPDRSKRSHHFDEQQEYCSLENPYFMDSESNPYDNYQQTKGTVWELVPARHREHMYPHQQEGFEFLWENLAETIELSRLQTRDPRGGGGGGCIISHAPGTGKTFLTIVFMESYLKKFPNCCPIIVAPASMLLTWEAEFQNWKVGISFINLQNTEPLREEKIIGNSRYNKEYIRALKICSWIHGRGVLGVSYNLFEKLTRTSNKKKTDRNQNLRRYLLRMPGLVVLDEGHTPRNQNSKIWNTLSKLETKNRVILSGTPFQNNFRELFNTLRIVRPATANIEKKRLFADMIQTNRKKSRGRSTSEDIEKLKEIISPFVHVHKGHILDSKLPGLKQSVILLNPPPYQNSFIENLGISASTFEYEHKVALLSVHPSLILHCSLSENEEKTINKQELEKKRLQPEVGVKTRFVMELIRLSLSLNEKVLIFSQYIQPSELLQEQIALTFGWEVEQEVTLIKGRISQSRRQCIINAFNDPKSDLKVLLASTKCCSEGIHLYGGSRVVLLDVVWNPSVERQAIHRAYRLGQKKVVYTYHLMVAGTTEEEKYDRQIEKGRLAEMVFSSAAMAGEEPKNKVNVNDKILQEMVDNLDLKDIFKKIRYPENQTRI